MRSKKGNRLERICTASSTVAGIVRVDAWSRGRRAAKYPCAMTDRGQGQCMRLESIVAGAATYGPLVLPQVVVGT